ncbi:MAG: DUF4142 domain-containing protein [Rickettsiales bacterium]
MRPTHFAISLLATALVTGSALAAELSTTTADFIKNASIGNRFEIESSELALATSKDEDIKNFAQHMVDDHGKAKEDMARAVKAAGIDSAAVPNSLDPKHQEQLNKLKSLKGEAFDSTYVEAQVQAHEEAVNLFRTYSNKGDQADLKTFATKTLPTLEKHQEAINDMQNEY